MQLVSVAVVYCISLALLFFFLASTGHIFFIENFGMRQSVSGLLNEKLLHF